MPWPFQTSWRLLDGVAKRSPRLSRQAGENGGACFGAERNLTKHTRRDGRGTKNKNKKTQATRSTTTALRVPGALGAAAQTYARCMDKAPLATKAATSAAIFGASDACAQKLERVKEPDATRLLTTTAIGGLYFAPAARTRRGIVRAERRGHASMASRWSLASEGHRARERYKSTEPS